MSATRYELMHGDHVAASVSISGEGLIASINGIVDRDRMPWGTVGSDDDDTLDRLRDWWNYRRIPRKRDIAETIRRLGFASNDELMVAGLAANLSDHYWIRPLGDDLCWDDVSLFTNSFSETLGRTLLGIGDGFEPSPDCSTDGMVPKMWTSDRRMLKGGTTRCRQQPYNEVLASEIMKRLEIDHVPYELTSLGSETFCTCPCIASEDVEMIQARCLMMTAPLVEGRTMFSHLLDRCESIGLVDPRLFIDRMLVIDHIMANNDRHYNNFSILRDPDSLEVLRFAPVYDTGSSLGYDLRVGDITGSETWGRTFKARLDDQLLLLGDTDWIDLDALRGIDSFARRLMGGSETVSPERVDAVVELLLSRIESLRDRIENPRGFRDEPSEDIPVRLSCHRKRSSIIRSASMEGISLRSCMRISCLRHVANKIYLIAILD